MIFFAFVINFEWFVPICYQHCRNNDDSVSLQPGMVITIEPALVEGHHAHATWSDGWSQCTVDGGLAAQFEHTILITDDGGPAEILTAWDSHDVI